MFARAFQNSAKYLLKSSQNGRAVLPLSSPWTTASKAFSTGTVLQRVAQINAKEGLIGVGDKAYVEKVYTKEDMVVFSEISGDKNPLHLDEDYARTTMFKRPIVYGALTFGLLSGAVATYLPGPGGEFISYTLKHPAPLYVGEAMRAEVEVLEKLPGYKLRMKIICTEPISGKVVAKGELVCKAPKERFGDDIPVGS